MKSALCIVRFVPKQFSYCHGSTPSAMALMVCSVALFLLQSHGLFFGNKYHASQGVNSISVIKCIFIFSLAGHTSMEFEHKEYKISTLLLHFK